MTTTFAHDLRASAALFHAAGIDDAEKWAGRCAHFGVSPRVAIERILKGRRGESVVPEGMRGERKRRR